MNRDYTLQIKVFGGQGHSSQLVDRKNINSNRELEEFLSKYGFNAQRSPYQLSFNDFLRMNVKDAEEIFKEKFTPVLKMKWEDFIYELKGGSHGKD